MPAAKEKISVIMPVYDAKDLLPLAVRSVLAQTHDDLELLLVEDGSPNGSGELCDRLAAQDSRVRVIHKPNGGAASARNAGLDAATGDYIGFVDSDDLVEPDFYAVLLAALQAGGCGMAACTADRIDENGSPLPGGDVDVQTPGVRPSLELFRDLFARGSIYPIVCWNKLFAARLWQGRRFDTSFRYGDDGNVMHLICDGQTTACVDRPLYHYRLRTGSMTASVFHPRRLDDLRLWHMWYRYFLDRPGCADLAQWCLADYWRRFYLLYLLARQDGPLTPENRAAFDQYLPQLRGLLGDIAADPHVPKLEKFRARLFAAAPGLAYAMARAWGRLAGGEKGA